MNTSSGSSVVPQPPSEDHRWNRCFKCGAGVDKRVQFLLTNCGHICCSTCKDRAGVQCPVCNKPDIKYMSITANMEKHPQVGHMFSSPAQLVSQLLQIINFHEMHMSHERAHRKRRLQAVSERTRQSRQQVQLDTNERQRMIARLAEADLLVRKMRACGLRNENFDKNTVKVLQQCAQLVNATKPGADLNKLGRALSRSVPQTKPASAPHTTSTSGVVMAGARTITHVPKTPQPAETPKSASTPKSSTRTTPGFTRSYYHASGTASRTLMATPLGKTIATPQSSRGLAMATPQSSRGLMMATPHSRVLTAPSSTMAHQFNLSSFSGSVQRPSSQECERGMMPPPPPPPTLCTHTQSQATQPHKYWSSPISVPSSQLQTYPQKRRTPASITPSPNVKQTTKHNKTPISGGMSTSCGYITPSYSGKKRSHYTPDSGQRLSLRARPVEGKLVCHRPSPSPRAGTPGSGRIEQN